MQYKKIELENGLYYLCPCCVDTATEIIDDRDKIIFQLSEKIDKLEKQTTGIT